MESLYTAVLAYQTVKKDRALLKCQEKRRKNGSVAKNVLDGGRSHISPNRHW